MHRGVLTLREVPDGWCLAKEKQKFGQWESWVSFPQQNKKGLIYITSDSDVLLMWHLSDIGRENVKKRHGIRYSQVSLQTNSYVDINLICIGYLPMCHLNTDRNFLVTPTRLHITKCDAHFVLVCRDAFVCEQWVQCSFNFTTIPWCLRVCSESFSVHCTSPICFS